MDAFVDMDIAELELLMEQQGLAPEAALHGGETMFTPELFLSHGSADAYTNNFDALEVAWLETVLTPDTAGEASDKSTAIFTEDNDPPTTDDDWCSGPLNDDECVVPIDPPLAISIGGLGGGAGSGGIGDVIPTPPEPPTDPDQDPTGDDEPHECTSENIGGVNIDLVPPEQDSESSTENSAIFVSALQAEAALEALSNAFSSPSAGSISIPGVGEVSLGNIFSGVLNGSLTLVVDNTLTDITTNSSLTDTLTVTTAAGDVLVIPPNTQTRGYIDTGTGNFYIDVDTGMRDGGFTGVMETIVHEIMHVAFPDAQLSEQQVQQLGQQIIAQLQANGALTDPTINLSETCVDRND